ncbi:response regulator transcription factor [Falsiroseomonas sp. HC035]|uniref:response regulator transcription factor n=1 Tax=Falsiroseomonas sp. HC035 TaxID=3390999 RepID=UPI003D312105
MAADSTAAPHDPHETPALPRPVLVVEDDAAVANTVCIALARDGWTTITARTLAEGRVRLHRDNPRLVIIDLGLPDGNGIAFVREAAGCPGRGIMVISGRGDEVDRVVGLEVGADDYLTKPFSLREMVARIRALSRRLDAVVATGPAEPLRDPVPVAANEPQDPPPAAAPSRDPSGWTLEGTRLQPARFRLVAADGTETRLTGGEAGLLALLLASPEHLVDRGTISEAVLGRRLLPEQRGVDQLTSNLRQKLLGASSGRISIAALRGKGYRLVW